MQHSVSSESVLHPQPNRIVAACKPGGLVPRVLASLLVVVASGCVTHVATPLDAPATERAVSELWQTFENAFNAGDAATAANCYAEDADRIGSSGVRITGRDQIEQHYAALLARRAADPPSAAFRPTIHIRVLHAEAALLDGSWSGMRAGVAVRGHFTMVATKRAGQWRLVAGRDLGIVPAIDS